MADRGCHFNRAGVDFRSITPRFRRSPGVTLVELLVVISIIAVLLGIMVTSLSGAKGKADLLGMLANQRGADGVLSSYLMDYNGAYPYWGDIGTNYAAFEWEGELIEGGHWGQPLAWGLYLHSLGYDGWVSLGPDAHPGSFEAIRDSDCSDCNTGQIMHMLTNTVYADPIFWREQTPYDKKYFRGMREADLAYPSQKGILILRGGMYDSGRIMEIVTFGDGHGEVVHESELNPGVIRGGVNFSGFPVYTTVDGVEGRDI